MPDQPKAANWLIPPLGFRLQLDRPEPCVLQTRVHLGDAEMTGECKWGTCIVIVLGHCAVCHTTLTDMGIVKDNCAPQGDVLND